MNNYYKDIEKIVEMRKKEDERDYIGLINAGVTAQIEKLRENEHKQAIETHSFDELEDLVGEEYWELMAELDKYRVGFNSIKEMRLEAADLANACHAIIKKCDKELIK